MPTFLRHRSHVAVSYTFLYPSFLSLSHISANESGQFPDPNPDPTLIAPRSVVSYEDGGGSARVVLSTILISKGTCENLVKGVGCVQGPPVVRKGKKKQAKDELDRLKQAEKKKRRLEKALATSAAIRSELEKKKQKKIEEQQRLDEEGAAIAEAVAMHVLLGEDSDESCKIMLKKNEGFNPWSRSSNMGLLIGGRGAGYAGQGFTKYSLEGVGWVSDTYGSGCKWNDCAISSWSPDMLGRDLRAPYFDERVCATKEISEGLTAAQGVSSLQIAEEGHGDAIIFNRRLRR